MNYYEHHLGDYLRDTAHLSMLEDGAYRRLLDAYYIREALLPVALRDVFRLVRAQSKQDRDAVEIVLREFFTETPEGWRHGRCDREIERFQDKQRKARASAEARWSQRQPHSEGNANASQDAMRTHSEGNAPRARPQTPDTRHQKPDTPQPPKGAGRSGSASRGEVHGFPPGFAEFWAAYPRKTAKGDAAKAFARIKPDAALLQAMLAAIAGQAASPQWTKDGGQFIPHPATWLNGRRWEDQAATQGSSPGAAKPWHEVRSEVIAMGCRVGIGLYREVDDATGRAVPFEDYRRRVIAAAKQQEQSA